MNKHGLGVFISWAFIIAGGLAGLSLPSAADQNSQPDGAAKKTFPRVPEMGGVYPVESAPALASESHYRLVFDVTESGTNKDMHASLEHAARALNLYALADVQAENVSVALVVHGEATPMVLKDDDYRSEFGVPNPNTEALKRLADMGVDLRICGQALYSAGFRPDQVSPEVTTELSAMTALVELQGDGYALIP